MKYTIGFLITVFAFSVLAQNKQSEKILACEDKLTALSSQGVDRGAFLQALKNVRSGDKASRYVLMAQLGRQNEGTMMLVDTQTGKVEKFKMYHGTPENAADVLDRKSHELTYFGGQHLMVDEVDFRKSDRVLTKNISPSLINKLAMSGDNPGGNQVLLKCSKKFRENPQRAQASINDNCMEPEDVERVFKLLKAEHDASKGNPKPAVVMFTYPTRSLEIYLSQVKLQNDEPDVCKTLAQMPANVSGQGAGGGTPALTEDAGGGTPAPTEGAGRR